MVNSLIGPVLSSKHGCGRKRRCGWCGATGGRRAERKKPKKEKMEATPRRRCRASMGSAGLVRYAVKENLAETGPASPLALRSPNFLLCQPELSFSRFGVSELALAGVARDLGSGHGTNSFVNFTEFVPKYSRALMQSLYDVHKMIPLQVYFEIFGNCGYRPDI